MFTWSQRDGIGEYYMVLDHVWHEATYIDEKHGNNSRLMARFLCIGCLEKRLGRMLTPDDFSAAPINDVRFFSKSDRLCNRITGTWTGGSRG